MRPVVKWPIGHVFLAYTIQQIYNPYNSAKPLLESNIGVYCSYCERCIEDEAMHVEHIQPKSLPQYNHLEFEWTNFLVACHRCNGADNKGSKDVIYNDIHMPHLNNTFLSIAYFSDGTVGVKAGLDAVETAKATALIRLVGLDKIKGHPEHKEGDKRFERRKKVYVLAERCKDDYQSKNTNISAQNIADLALPYGFWSVWMEVFNNIPEVEQELISRFAGTLSDCKTVDIDRNPLP